MIRGLYTAAAGMIVNSRQSDTIDENIENLRNPGYREASERITSFPRLLAQRIEPSPQTPKIVNLGIMGTGVYADRMFYKAEPGNLRKTESMTDLALNSKGYFVVQTLQGERYTRNGHFQIDPSRRLRTAGGNFVLGENGIIGPLPKNFEVQLDGTIVDKETHAVIDRLRIVNIPAEALRREGKTSLFRAVVDPTEAARDDIRIHQGFVEESNVDLDAQMVKMLQVLRAYSANQKVVQINDSLLQKAVNEIGRL